MLYFVLALSNLIVVWRPNYCPFAPFFAFDQLIYQLEGYKWVKFALLVFNCEVFADMK